MYDSIIFNQKDHLFNIGKELLNKDFSIVTTHGKVSNCKNDSNVKMTLEQLHNNIYKKNCNGLGLLGSKFLQCVDFDSKDDFNQDRSNRELIYCLKDTNLLNKVAIQQTPSNSRHIIYKLDSKVYPVTGSQARILKPTDNKPKDLVNIRSINQYVCIAPTPNYNFIHGSLNKLQPLSQNEYNSLLSVFRGFDRYKHIEEIERLKAEKEALNRKLQQSKVKPNHSTDNVSLSVWDDYNNRNHVSDILTKNGFSFRYSSNNKDYYLRNGSKSKNSGFIQEDLYVNFSDNAGLPNGKNGTGRKFNAYELTCYLEYKGDFSKCAIELFKQGYGKINNNNSYIKKSLVKATKQKDFYINLLDSQFVGTEFANQNFKVGITKILGGTGIGKTRFSSDLANVRGFDVVIVSRNITTLENYEQYGFVRFTKSFNRNEDFKADVNAMTKKLTVTYNSLCNLLNSIDYSKVIFVFDEFHLLAENVYREVRKATKAAYEKLIELSKTNICLLLSANNVSFSDSRLKINSTYHFRKKSVSRNVLVTSEATEETLIDSINNALKTGNKALVYTNLKEDKELSQLIKNAFKGKKIHFFNADNNNEDLTNFDYDVVICTNALVTGKDIKQENVTGIVYLSHLNRDASITLVNQFLGRLRNFDSCNFELLISWKFDNENYRFFNVEQQAQNYKDESNAIIKSCVNCYAYYSENNHNFVTRLENNQYKINTHAIDVQVRKDVSKTTLRNSKLLKEFLELHQYKTTFVVNEKSEEKAKKEKTGLSKKELYHSDLESIKSDISKVHDLDDNSTLKNRYLTLKDCIEESEILPVLERFDTAMKFQVFTSLLETILRVKVIDKNTGKSDRDFNRNYINIAIGLDVFDGTEKTKIVEKNKTEIVDFLSSYNIVGTSNKLTKIIRLAAASKKGSKPCFRKLIKELKTLFLVNQQRRYKDNYYIFALPNFEVITFDNRTINQLKKYIQL